jgi:phosphatidylserine decarboxylase
MGSLIDKVFQQEDINFVLTNKIPRKALTRFIGWFSDIEQPLVRDVSIGVWKLFAGDLRLHEAKKTRFASLHDCFVRELKDGARTIDRSPDVLVSPCDAIVGCAGPINGTELIQAKRFTYTLEDLVADAALVDRYRNGLFVTLRLTSSMYHRFHAPYDCEVDLVRYISGDTWNVNPIALRRVARLFCKNERAVVETTLRGSRESVTLVAVGAILVASIQLNFVQSALNLQYRGPNHIRCRAGFGKGDEMGYFRHGSTIIVLATPGLQLCSNVREGTVIRVGQPLLVHASIPQPAHH